MFISLIFNSLILVILNFILIMNFGIKVLKNHYKSVSEIKSFNSDVCESRLNLNLTTEKLSEAIKEIEDDIADELEITHGLTRLNAEMKIISERLFQVEQQIIKLVQTDYTMENRKISTPIDINKEIDRILIKTKKNK